MGDPDQRRRTTARADVRPIRCGTQARRDRTRPKDARRPRRARRGDVCEDRRGGPRGLRNAGSAGSRISAEPSTRLPSSRVRDSRGVIVDLAELTRDLESLRDAAIEAARTAASSDALAEREVEYLGKKGRLTAVLRGI